MTKDLHGGNIYKFKDNILDYSSNINPLGVPKTYKEKVFEKFDDITRYPDPYYNELRESLARYNGINKTNIVVGNGATEVLFLTMKALAPKKTLIVVPTFAEYERAIKSNTNSEIFYYLLNLGNVFELDELINTIKSIRDLDLVVLCNPNNPTGSFIKLETIEKLNDFLKKRDINLFIDEAFIEFTTDYPQNSAINLKNKNIYIMRAFTKFFAIPGVRLGYMISFDDEYITTINETREPWSVNTFANIAGIVLSTDDEYIENTRNWIETEKIWFYDNLLNIKNIAPYKTDTNFMLIKLLKHKSHFVVQEMLKRKIFIRDAQNFMGLDDSYIRLAIKNRDNNIKVLKALGEVICMDS